MKTISSRRNPIVRTFRALADAPDAGGTRVLLDGLRLVREARAAALEFEAVAVASSHLNGDTEEGRMARALDSAGAPVFTVSEAAFAAVSPVWSPSGIVAIVWRKPSDPTAICRATSGFTLIAVDIQDPGNLGALIRAAEAGGVTGVLVAGASANPFSWKALRGSMGSALRLPIAGRPGAGDCRTLCAEVRFEDRRVSTARRARAGGHRLARPRRAAAGRRRLRPSGRDPRPVRCPRHDPDGAAG